MADYAVVLPEGGAKCSCMVGKGQIEVNAIVKGTMVLVGDDNSELTKNCQEVYDLDLGTSVKIDSRSETLIALIR